MSRQKRNITPAEPERETEPALEAFIVADLRASAQKACENSYSPYSGYPVGAAVLAADGRIFSGTNFENASYGLTICAERAAVACAISQGQRQIRAVAVFAPTDEPPVPCGACLAVISEFADPDFEEGNIPILLSGKIKKRWLSLDQLLPEKFKLKPKEL